VRVITRLDETCREVRDAARVIGDAELFKKMEEAQNKIKRDSECKPTIEDSSTMTTRMLSQLYSRPVCISSWAGRSTPEGQHMALMGMGWYLCWEFT